MKKDYFSNIRILDGGMGQHLLSKGLETKGTLERPVKEGSENYVYGNFTILTFSSKADQVLQQIFITYLKDDVYLNQIHDRIIDSIELKPKKDEEN